MNKKKSKKVNLNLTSRVTCLSFKFYAEQCDALDRFTDYSFEEQVNTLNETLRDVAKNNLFNVYGIVHDKDYVSKDFFKPSVEKPHAHLILKSNEYELSGRLKRFSISDFLFNLSMSGVKFDEELDVQMIENKGIIPLDCRKDEDKRMIVYLTHETTEAIKDLKIQYPRTSVITNDENIGDIFDYYFEHLDGNKKEVELNYADMARSYGTALRPLADLKRELPTKVRIDDRQMKIIRNAYNVGVEDYIETHNKIEKVCIYISGATNMGKTFSTNKVLKELTGFAPYKITSTNKGSGKFDDYIPGQSIIYDDTRLDCPLTITDMSLVSLHRRNSDNPYFIGDYLIATSNDNFKVWLDYLNTTVGYTVDQLKAIKTRFFIIDVGIDGEITATPPSELRVSDEEEARHLINKFKAFYDKFSYEVKEYAKIKHSGKDVSSLFSEIMNSDVTYDGFEKADEIPEQFYDDKEWDKMVVNFI